MRSLFVLIVSAGFLASCSSLPVPGPIAGRGSSAEAKTVLARSSARHGNSWEKYRRVEVSYAGEWSTLATKVQPVITDPDFRKSSTELYQPRSALVRQIHSGPKGNKEVVRQKRRIEVKYNGIRSAEREVEDAASLVSDAYTVFLFGPSWLAERGRDLDLLDDRTLAGERCRLVAGRLSPGFGNSGEDHFIVWIETESGLMRRFQFSLNGMESTRGADVDVEFSEYHEAADGSVWPGHFVETIQRPILVKAHDWRMTSLTLDGRSVFRKSVPSI